MIDPQEIADLLYKVARGETSVALADGEYGWRYEHWANDSSDITYLAAGWRLTVFIDVGDLDYVDSVVAPDGRRGEFDDWCVDSGPTQQPLDLLDGKDFRKLVDALDACGRLVG